MTKNTFRSTIKLLVIFCTLSAPGTQGSAQVLTEPPSGIRGLQTAFFKLSHTLHNPQTRLLVAPEEIVDFLSELDGTAPEWGKLHDEPGEEHGERLFQLNRIRDKAREGNLRLQQHIAFFWSGILRKVDTTHQGFRVAVGPVLTETDWGIIRFKPVNLPHAMIAIPSKNLFDELRRKTLQGELIEINILFTGMLAPQESLMYAFSHDGSENGMILPFVYIDSVQYFLK